jgi:hypothetical protein
MDDSGNSIRQGLGGNRRLPNRMESEFTPSYERKTGQQKHEL